MSGFDFETVGGEAISHVEVADTVLWPMVDLIWGGDWREDTYPSNYLHLQKFSELGGITVRTLLNAETEICYPDGHDCPSLLNTVNIVIEEFYEHGAEYDYILGKIAECMKMEKDELYSRDDQVLKSVKGTSYVIDSDGELSVDNFLAVSDSVNNELYNTSEIITYMLDADDDQDEAESDDTEVVQDVLRSPDIDVLRIGLLVLKAPEKLVIALDSFQDNGL